MKSKYVYPYYNPNKVYVWRNKMTDGYKVGQVYQDQPMDLSNYLLIRTREAILL